MSENAPKILIVVLVILVVLFFVGIGVGTGEGIDNISVDSVINTLAGLFPSPAVSSEEIQPTDCFDQGARRIIIPGGGECELEILESSANIRSLKLEIVAGGAAHLELTVSPAEDQEMVITTDLPNNGDRQIDLTLFPSGGSLIIDECVASGGGACVINIVN